MTTYFKEEKVCAYCGKTVNVTVIGSTNAFGACDLDMRPPEMKRSTVRMELQVCPYCGYANYDLEKTPKNVEKFREIFPALPKGNNIVENYRLAGDIRRLADDNHDLAFCMYLYGAWCADDMRNAEDAKKMRMLALQEAKCLLKEKKNLSPDFILRVSDIARRVEKFDYASSLLEQANALSPRDLVAKLIAFEQRLIDAKDTACHSISEAEK